MPFTSPWTSARNVPNQTLWEFIESSSSNFADDALLLQDDNTKAKLTCGEHLSQAKEFGTGLLSKWKWEKGQVLLVLGRNHIDIGSIAAGTHYAGGVVTPGSPFVTHAQLVFQLTDSKCRAIVSHPDNLELVKEAAKEAGIAEEYILTLGDSSVDDVAPWRSISSSDTAEHNHARANPESEAYIVYTSGTTGSPKGALISHTCLITQVLHTSIVSNPFMVEKETTMCAPWWTIGGVVCREYAFHHAHLAILSQDFSLPGILRLIQTYKITWAFVPAMAIGGFLKNPPLHKFDISSVKFFGVLGATWPPSYAKDLWEKFHIRVRNHYGMTETCGQVASQTIVEAVSTIGTAGHLLPGVQMKIMSPEGTEIISDGTVGACLIKTPTCMMGYLNRPDATATAFDEDGYYRTGDVASIRDGLVTVHGRLTDQLTWKGVSYMNSAVEKVLRENSKVADCCVVATKGEEGERSDPTAFIVAAPESEPNKSGIIDYIKDNCEEAMWLRGGVVYVPQIPRNPVGKVLLSALFALTEGSGPK